MATTQTRSSPIRSKFFGEVDNLSHTSLSSREVHTTGSAPKVRPTLPGFMGSFGRTRGLSKMSKGVTEEDLNTTDCDPLLNEKVVDDVGPTPTPISTTQTSAPGISPKNTIQQTEDVSTSTPAPRALSRYRTILRLITTKFRPPPSSSPSTLTPPHLAATPTVPISSVSKETNDATLQERSLLPPLKPSPDPNVQEQEQDQHLTVVNPVDRDEDSGQVTSAKQVEQEKEAQDEGSDSFAATASASSEKSAPVELLDIFDFGSGSPTSPTSTGPEVVPHSERDTLVEVDTPVLSPPSPTSPQPSLSVPQTPTKDKSHSPSLRSECPPRPPTLDLSSSTPRTHRRPPPSPTRPLPTAPADLDADFFKASTTPLPPSPFIFPSSSRTPSTSTTSLLADAYSIPLPPSPLPGSVPATPRSAKSTAKGTETPKALESTASSATATPIPSPPPSFTPPASPTPDALIPPIRTRAHSFPVLRTLSESESLSTSSMTTPSLSVDTSTIATASSFDSPSLTTPGSLKPQMHDLGIPMIVESPVEESTFSAEPASVNAEGEVKSGETVPAEAEPSHLNTRARPRGTTDPNPSQASRPKSTGLFRRGNTTDTTSPTVPKRLSVSTSLSNLRRSVIGTLSRPKSTLSTPTTSPGSSRKSTFDTSQLPPSPTVPKLASSRSSPSANISTPSRLAPPLRVNTVGADAAPRTGQALSPTVQSRGSMVMEKIEDEESSRLSELAFM